VFNRERNVRDFGINFEEAASPASGNWSHSSEGSIDWSTQAKADAQSIPNIPQGTAGLQVKFNRAHAVVLQIPSGTESTITDIYKLKQQLIASALNNNSADQYPEDFAVVTSVVTADAATVLISEQAGAELTVSASADFKAGLASIADASLEITVKNSRQVKTELVAAKLATPLIQGIKLKRNWWGELRADALDSRVVDELPFVDLSPVTATS
jgi:hypothetical protein